LVEYNFNHYDRKYIFDKIKEDPKSVEIMSGDDEKPCFAIGVKVIPYPENFLSVWVIIAMYNIKEKDPFALI
jgi:hypothetical protein